ncbi:MAG TPA: hypothetical protein PL070_10770 [Flavobacteriales bacterium]|nr:hypothetical protein [Flavobacteriales bacterium]
MESNDTDPTSTAYHLADGFMFVPCSMIERPFSLHQEEEDRTLDLVTLCRNAFYCPDEWIRQHATTDLPAFHYG